jgi:hypothetical protein
MDGDPWTRGQGEDRDPDVFAVSVLSRGQSDGILQKALRSSGPVAGRRGAGTRSS